MRSLSTLFVSAILIACVPATLSAAPFFTVSLEARPAGTGTFSSALGVAVGETYDYRVSFLMSPIGTTNTNPAGTVNDTINSYNASSPAVTSNGLNNIKLSVFQNIGQQIQVDFGTPVLDVNFDEPPAASLGADTNRGNGNSDFIGVASATTAGTFQGIGAPNTPVKTTLFSGQFTVTDVGDGTSSLAQVGIQGFSGTFFGMKYNSSATFNGTTAQQSGASPVVGFQGFTMSLSPPPGLWLGGTTSWNVASNWQSGAVPTSLTAVSFPEVIPASGATVNLPAGAVAASVEFKNDYTLSGGSLAVSTGTISVAAGKTATLSTVLAGTNGFNKTDAGTLVIATDSSVVGARTVSGGVLSIDSDSRLASGGTLTLNGGALRQTSTSNAAAFLSPTTTLEVGIAGGTVDYTSSGAGTVSIYDGTITGTGGTISNGGRNTLTKTGPGEFRYQGAGVANTTFAKLAVNQGIFRAGTADERAFGAVPTSTLADAITLNGGGIGNTVNTTLHANRGITLGASGGAVNVAAGTTLSIPSVISGAGVLTQSGPGTLQLTGTNTYGGGTILNGGVLSISADSNLGAPGTPLTFNGGTLRCAAPFIPVSGRTVTLGAGGGTIDTNGFNVNMLLNVSGPGGFTKSGNGALTVLADSTYGGATTITAGKLSVLASLSSGPLTNSGQLASTGANLSFASASTNSAGAQINLIDSTLSFTSGALTNSGQINLINCTVNGDVHSNPGGVINTAGDVTFTGNVSGPSLLQVNNDTTTVSGGVVGTGPLTKSGGGTLALTGAASYTGATAVNAGTLAATNGFKGGGPMTIAAGARAVIPEATPNAYDPGNNIYPSGSNDTASRISSLAIAGTGVLDLGNSDLVIDHNGASPLDGVAALLQSGFNGGSWDGPGITTNTLNVNNPSTLNGEAFALGYAENYALPMPYGTELGGPLFGNFEVDDTTVLIKFTWIGDATLDGFIDFSDLAVVNTHYDGGQSTGRHWFEGDFNYDGKLDFSDLSLFNTNYDPTKPSLPEPASLAIAAVGFVAISLRRHRSNVPITKM